MRNHFFSQYNFLMMTSFFENRDLHFEVLLHVVQDLFQIQM